MKNLSLLLFLPFLLSGCHNCESDHLPVLLLFHSQSETPEFVSVYNEYVEFAADEYRGRLPLTLNSDTTIFYFETAEGQTDTLGIRYSRNAEFENTGCGFFFSVEDPEILPFTTFKGAVVEMIGEDVEVRL